MVEHAGFLFALKEVIDLASPSGLVSKVQNMRKVSQKHPKLANYASRNDCKARRSKSGFTARLVGKVHLPEQFACHTKLGFLLL